MWNDRSERGSSATWVESGDAVTSAACVESGDAITSAEKRKDTELRERVVRKGWLAL